MDSNLSTSGGQAFLTGTHKMSVAAKEAKGVIRIVFAKNPPDASIYCNSFPALGPPSMDCPFPGWLVEVVVMLAETLNLHIEPIIIRSPVGSVNWGHNNNGSWTGILGILQQGMADTVCTLYPFEQQKAQYFDVSHPVTGVRDVFIAKPKRKSISQVGEHSSKRTDTPIVFVAFPAVWNAFLPYEPKLWALLLLSLVLHCGVATLMSNMEFRLNLRSTYSPLEKMWQYLRLQIHQATEFQTPFLLQSGNLAFLFYALIQATLFTQLYTAVLLSALIRGQNPSPWHSYKEMVNLVRSGTYTMVMDKHHLDKDNTFYETLHFTNISYLRNLADAVEHNPVIVVDTVTQALDYVEQGGYILPSKQYSLAYQLSKERCDFYYFEDDNNQISTFFLFSKQSKLLRDWNSAIQKNRAFIRRTYEKYFLHEFNTGKRPDCKKGSPQTAGEDFHGNTNAVRDASRSLDIVSTFGIFLIALIGFSLAFLVLICELIVHAKAVRLHRKWRTRRALVYTATNPTHLLAIARRMNALRRQQMGHTDSQNSADGPTAEAIFSPSAIYESGPPRLAKSVERSWWQRKVKEQPCEMRRQRSVISAVTLAALSAAQNNGTTHGDVAMDGLRHRQRSHGNDCEGEGWAVLENGSIVNRNEENGDGWARTTF